MTMAWDAAWIGMRGMHCRCEHNTPFCWLCVCMFSVVFWGVASLLLCLCVSVVSVALLLISTHCCGERQIVGKLQCCSQFLFMFTILFYNLDLFGQGIRFFMFF